MEAADAVFDRGGSADRISDLGFLVGLLLLTIIIHDWCFAEVQFERPLLPIDDVIDRIFILCLTLMFCDRSLEKVKYNIRRLNLPKTREITCER